MRQRQEDKNLQEKVKKNNSELDSEESLNYEWVLVGQRGTRTMIKVRKRTQERNKRQRSPEHRGTSLPAKETTEKLFI